VRLGERARGQGGSIGAVTYEAKKKREKLRCLLLCRIFFKKFCFCEANTEKTVQTSLLISQQVPRVFKISLSARHKKGCVIRAERGVWV
jgi:hypothetical protein